MSASKTHWIKGPKQKGQKIIKPRPGPGKKGHEKWFNPNGEDFCVETEHDWAMSLFKDGAVDLCEKPKPPLEGEKRKNTKE